MARRRHQLERQETVLALWWLGGALAVLAGAAAFALDAAARVLSGTMCAAVAAVMWSPGLAERWAKMWRRAVLPMVTLMLALDVAAGNRPFPAGARVVMLVLLWRAVTPRGQGGERQLAGLGLLLVVMGGVAAESVWFAVHLAAFVSGALLMFWLRTQEAGLGNETVRAAGWWRRVLREDWRVWLPGVIFFALITLGGTVVFFAAPRAARAGQFPVMERLFSTEQARSGFSDTIRFGERTPIQADDAVAFRVDFGKEGVTAAARGGRLYWRMIVLDEYRNHEFRLSAGLRAGAFGGREAVWKIGDTGALDEDKNARTFFLEPGVAGWVPLPEDFSGAEFSKSVEARVSETLRAVDLGSAPGKMIAYRVNVEPGVRKMDANALADETQLGDMDHATLAAAVSGIRGGREMRAVDFAIAASAWIGARHAYSLASELPREGGRDPLVRWAVSRAAGHCELFAGTLVLLLREAGFEARVAAGFAGGELNGDYLVVRNSQAHAWCEVFDDAANEGRGAWARVDPTLWAGGAAGDADVARSNIATMRAGAASWLDAWRVRWYRHVANFGGREQATLWSRVRDACGAAWACASEAARVCANAPWRVASFACALVCAAGLWRGAGRAWWILWRARREGGDAFARREAGRWLQKLSTAGKKHGHGARADLLRVRYGRRESWPELRGVWRAARSELRARARQKTKSKKFFI